jgi:Cytochrome P460
MSQLEKVSNTPGALGLLRGHRLRRIAVLLVWVAALAGGVGYIAAAGQPDEKAAPIFVDKIPDGYRDWKLISVAHEEGNLNSLGAILGNDVAIKAYREGKLPYPDGAIIAALHWSHAPSEENNKIFGRRQSFVAASPTNVQFMVKDSKKYASTGGWGFGHFNERDGNKPGDAALLKTCFACHQKAKDSDLVFTRYAP